MCELREWASSFYTVVAIAVAAAALLYGFERYSDVLPDYPRDAYIDWGGARAVLAGSDPYGAEALQTFGLDPVRGLGHPPTTLVWFLPLARFNVQTMKLVWDELTLLLLLLMVQMLVAELALPAPPATTALLFGLVLATSWMRDHLAVVQMSTLIAFLYTVAWYFLRRDRDVPAGIALGLALTVKFYPGFVIVLLLLCRRLRVATAAAATWLVVAVTITSRLGFGSWGKFLAQTRWYALRWTADVRNASLQGVFQRLYWRLCENPPGSQHPLWQPGALLATACAFGLGALALRLGRRGAGSGQTIDLPFALFAALSMVVGPYTWEHYNVTLVLPLMVATVAIIRLRQRGLSGQATVLGVATLLAIGVMLSLDIYDKTEVWHRFAADHSLHLQLHVLEVLNWLPATLTIALLGALTASSERDGFRAVARLRLAINADRAS